MKPDVVLRETDLSAWRNQVPGETVMFDTEDFKPMQTIAPRLLAGRRLSFLLSASHGLSRVGITYYRWSQILKNSQYSLCAFLMKTSTHRISTILQTVRALVTTKWQLMARFDPEIERKRDKVT
jgi:hypothetical protein